MRSLSPLVSRAFPPAILLCFALFQRHFLLECTLSSMAKPGSFWDCFASRSSLTESLAGAESGLGCHRCEKDTSLLKVEVLTKISTELRPQPFDASHNQLAS